MSGYLGGRLHEDLDRFAVKYLGRPDREQRYENRARMLPQAIEGSLLGASLVVGTGRVRIGQLAMKAGHKQIITASASLGRWQWPRSRGRLAMTAVPDILAGARQIQAGSRIVRQGRFLQGLGFIGWLYHR